MNRRIKPLTVFEYLQLLDYAKNKHVERDEPIPSFQQSKINELESCLQTPFQGFGGVLFYKGFIKKACMLFYLLSRNHVLTNGNKRLACLCLSYFCYRNGYILFIPEFIFYRLAKETVLADENNKEKTIKAIEKTIKQYLIKR